jgi:hypothetical protein
VRSLKLFVETGSMSQHTIVMSGQRYTVQIYQYAHTVWIADGAFLGHQLRARGSTAKKAVTAWQNAAVNKLRISPSDF